MPRTDPGQLRNTAAGAIVLDTSGKLLLHRRADNGFWSIPGGAVEKGETAPEAAVRETKEETGYDVKVVRLLGIDSTPTYPDGSERSWVLVLFECSVVGGEPTLGDETTEVGWHSPDALPQDMHEPSLHRIHDALMSRTTPYYR